MDIAEERFCDHGDKNPDGSYDYYYSGVIYTLRDGDYGWEARAYDHEMDTVSFLSSLIHKKTSRGSKVRRKSISEVPYQDPHFRIAVDALLGKNHQRVEVLTGCGYEKVDLSRLVENPDNG